MILGKTPILKRDGNFWCRTQSEYWICGNAIDRLWHIPKECKLQMFLTDIPGPQSHIVRFQWASVWVYTNSMWLPWNLCDALHDHIESLDLGSGGAYFAHLETIEWLPSGNTA